jgi:cytochrome c peroxidase
MRVVKHNTVIAVVFVISLGVLAFTSATVTRAQEQGNYGVGIPEVFLPKYLEFRAAQLSSSTPHVMRIKLGYVKGLSKSFIRMVGEAAFDLESGAVTVNLSGLTPLQTYTVWLVDTDGDPPVAFVSFVASGTTAILDGILPQLVPTFTIDRVNVAEGLLFGAPLGAGTVNVFQKAFFRKLSILNESTGVLLFDETTTPPALFDRVPALEFETDSGSVPLFNLAEFKIASETAAGSSGRAVKVDRLISRGAELFFEETFAGNGRTCGTCHPASNNFMIDKDFIATRPANDPLFVAEFNPALAQLERPKLMRSFGLILENLDGFSDPTQKFVMRGVPHTLGMQVSLTPDPTQTPTPASMIGWSGDGAPGTGSLRDFATGAVTQHFTKRIDRVAGVDFRLPEPRELDAMEAFQLSLGRTADFNLALMTFNDAAVQTGKNLFINGTGNPNAGGRCTACHNNAGALTATGPNGNFNTNVEAVAHPARSIENFPKDGGFGRTANGDGTFGNRTFNTASVVEAADTPPFFHNNVVATLEGVMDFYTGPEFNNPIPAQFRFAFNQTQRNQIADFMRAINTLQNIDVARRELKEILDNRNDAEGEQQTRLQTAFEDTQDGIDVLNEGGIFPAAVTRLTEARNLIGLAQSDPGNRRLRVQEAIAKLDQARAIIAS